MSSYTPFPSTSSVDRDENEWWLDREISLIRNLLDEEGELDRVTLGCKYWGPLRFRNALKEAVPTASVEFVSLTLTNSTLDPLDERQRANTAQLAQVLAHACR